MGEEERETGRETDHERERERKRERERERERVHTLFSASPHNATHASKSYGSDCVFFQSFSSEVVHERVPSSLGNSN